MKKQKDKMILGIDPGITGAISAYFDVKTAGRWCDVWDIPVMAKSGGKGQQINPYALYELFSTGTLAEYHCDYVFLEQVNAMPGQGVTSVFSFGRSLGIIEGVLASLKFPVVMISPNKWKKAAGLTGKEKDVARTLAIQLYPELQHKLQRKKDIGRADAILIRHFGEKIYTEK